MQELAPSLYRKCFYESKRFTACLHRRSSSLLMVSRESNKKKRKSKNDRPIELKTDKTPESDRPVEESQDKPKLPLKPVETTAEPVLLNTKQVLLNRYEVTGILGRGGFAQIYMAYDKDEKRKCVVKIEPKVDTKERKRMKLEIIVLTLLRATEAHVPELIAYGSTPDGQYLVMSLVGKNLSEVRRLLPGKKLTKKTLYRTMKQIAIALRSVHEIGFLHRDLKPSNFCIGTVDHTRIYLLDYGLARQYVTGAGMFRKGRDRVGMRGTMRYLNLKAHEGQEYGPYTDLIAFIYSTVELGCGGLPWSKMTKEAEIVSKKENVSVEKLCSGLKELLKLAKYALNLEWNTLPDYEFILKEITACIPANTSKDELYDWEVYRIAIATEIKKDVENFNRSHDAT